MSPAGVGEPVLLPAAGHRPPPPPSRAQPGGPIGPVAFLGVTLASLGGPLALAALYVPGILADASASAGLVTLAGAVVFGVPLLVWLRYSRQVTGPGGLYGFVLAAAGRRVATVQAGLWIASYLLYLIYTTAFIVYDLLPTVLPGIRPYRPLLELALPVALAAVMLAGRAVTVAVLGALAAGQMLLLAVLAAVSIGHAAPATSFAAHPPAGALGSAAGQVALLYVCGSLPLFLGGELAHPARTVRRGLTAGYALAAAGVCAVVFPLAANPAFTRAPIPGMSLAEVFATHQLAVGVGLGVAASTAAVMLVEYLALTRLVHALTARPTATITRALAIVLVAAAPVSLINPDRFYADLLKPSLIALWLSQLIVFAVYPRFTARHRPGPRTPDLLLAVAASAFAVYGLYTTVQQASS